MARSKGGDHNVLRVSAFDLETSNLNADYGRLLVAVVWTSGERKPKVFRADLLNPNWDNDREDDSAIVAAVAEELSRADILIAHNGAQGGFDVPFLQSRMAQHGMGAFPKKKIIDPVRIARQQFRVSNNSLDTLSAHLGLTPKMKLPPKVWVRASHNGDRDAMDTITARCISDVKILCGIARCLKGYCSIIDSRGSAW